jgi:hypothetical protein
MNELDTLNMLLRLIGVSYVNSLETDHPDSVNARTTMNRVSKRIQTKGWWFNTDYSIRYVRNSANEIRVPSQVVSMQFDDPSIIQRGNKLYDRANNTFQFKQDITAIKVIRVLDWDDMPDLAQMYCAYYAGAEFVRDELEDPSKEKSLQASAASSLIDLNQQELREHKPNIFAKPRVLRARSGIRPYATSRKFYGTPDR